MLRRMKDSNTEGNAASAAAHRRQLSDRAKEFADIHIAQRTDLHDQTEMPSDLWQALGDAGLAKIALPLEYGGMGGDYRALAMAAEAMAETGGNLGMVTSWMGRQLISRLHIWGHGTTAQRSTYLPDLAAGKITPCLAISEPNAGAHPKHLATTARRTGDGDFILNGEKAYLTNGPIADIFLILAITGTKNDRKEFSILIVPRDAPGLRLTEGVKIDYLRPSPHCGLMLQDVRVPVENLLGPEGDAFNAISLPMRRTEDAIFAASKAGALRHILKALSGEIKDLRDKDDALAELGKLSAATYGLGALALYAAELLEIDAIENADEVSAIAASAREWAGSLNERIHSLIVNCGIEPSPSLAAECRDFEKSLGIARAAYAIQARRRGLTLLDQNGKNPS
jgi:acyl-CoA dehydrogenase